MRPDSPRRVNKQAYPAVLPQVLDSRAKKEKP
jgi:hypothetical protein